MSQDYVHEDCEEGGSKSSVAEKAGENALW